VRNINLISEKYQAKLEEYSTRKYLFPIVYKEEKYIVNPKKTKKKMWTLIANIRKIIELLN
jgi:hypothetical protein